MAQNQNSSTVEVFIMMSSNRSSGWLLLVANVYARVLM